MKEKINTIASFLGVRDIPELTIDHLKQQCGILQVDVMVLFGGSIICGGDVLAEAMKRQVAKTYIIVGGEGHTTQALRDEVQRIYPDFETEGLAEAEVFSGYLIRKYGLKPDFIETKSTNCGNNITNLLALLEEKQIVCNSIILSQDATMQRRMAAGLLKYRPNMQIINYATYCAKVEETFDGYRYEHTMNGMWNMDRYLSLLMGEIPRLRDDEFGYGPQGKGYIEHVDIPREVCEAFEFLQGENASLVRVADERYKS